MAFAFGLLHGFGFASGLTTMGLPPSEIPLALLLLNVRVEVGQLSFVLLGLLLEQSFRVLEIRWARWVGGLASGLLHPISGLDPVVAMIAVGACIGFDTVGPP